MIMTELAVTAGKTTTFLIYLYKFHPLRANERAENQVEPIGSLYLTVTHCFIRRRSETIPA